MQQVYKYFIDALDDHLPMRPASGDTDLLKGLLQHRGRKVSSP
jgi:hypothetical protein